MEVALKAATHPHDFKLLVSSDGLRSTSVESVMARPARSDEPVAARRAGERRRAGRQRRARGVTRTLSRTRPS